MADEIIKTYPSKFGLWFLLKAQTFSGDIVEITYPLTCEFQVVRNNLASVNSATFTIYNLNERTRFSLFKDSYDITFRTIEFYAGYRSRGVDLVPLVFSGSIRQCYSERSGSDYKTVFDCYDGQQSMAAGFISSPTTAGVNLKDQVAGLISQLPNIKGGVVGDSLQGQSKRGSAQFGNPAEIIKNLTGNELYIDNMNAYSLDTTEVLSGESIVITSESGIVDIPKKTETSVEMSLIFEPRLKVSQLVEVKSSANRFYNGLYKLSGLTHAGTISGSVASDVVTKLTMLSMTPGYFKVIKDNNNIDGIRVVRSIADVPK